METCLISQPGLGSRIETTKAQLCGTKVGSKSFFPDADFICRGTSAIFRSHYPRESTFRAKEKHEVENLVKKAIDAKRVQNLLITRIIINALMRST